MLCSLVHSPIAYAANDSIKKDSVILVYDSTKIAIRKPDATTQKELLENSDYKYDRVGPAPKSDWDRFVEWFWRTVDKIFDTEGGKIGFSIFQYVLIIAVVVIIVFLVLKNNIRALFYGKSASVPIDFKEFEEDIHNINFDELIADAISKKDFRKAVRLHFLKLLKELTDKNLIKWQIDKTNNDYSIELRSSKFNSKFNELALLYEYVWYGDFQLDETNFMATIAKFNEFKVSV
jgi:hypothetical protein